MHLHPNTPPTSFAVHPGAHLEHSDPHTAPRTCPLTRVCFFISEFCRYAEHVHEALSGGLVQPVDDSDSVSRVVLLTNDADNRAKANADGLYAVSMRDYVTKDLKSVPDSLSLCFSRIACGALLSSPHSSSDWTRARTPRERWYSG
jgi:hypothetical protein